MIRRQIVSVTLNPAVDWVLEAPNFKVGSHIRARRIGWYPAGNGINVSRVLATLGTRSVATGFIGRGELTLFEEYLERVGLGRVVMQLLIVRGRTRDNMTFTDPINDTETHVRDEGFKVSPDDVRRIISKVGMLARDDSVVVFGGSTPPGVTVGDFRSMLHRCQDQGALTVVDTSERILEALRGEPIWMAKLNASELHTLSQMPTETEEQVIEAARAVSRTGGGQVKIVVATRGADGAVLIAPGVERVAKVAVHPGLICNTVGCGDSLLAGLIHAWSVSHDWERALAMGVATATANAISRTPGAIDTNDVSEYLGSIIMRTL